MTTRRYLPRVFHRLCLGQRLCLLLCHRLFLITPA
jgi:hypothetical protein